MTHEIDIDDIRDEVQHINLALPIRWQNSLAGTDKTLEELKDSKHIPYLTAKKNKQIRLMQVDSYYCLKANEEYSVFATGLITCALVAYIYPNGEIFAYHAPSSGFTREVMTPAIDFTPPPCSPQQVKILIATRNKKDSKMDKQIEQLQKNSGVDPKNIFVYYAVGTEFGINNQGCIGIRQQPQAQQLLTLKIACISYLEQAIDRYKSQAATHQWSFWGTDTQKTDLEYEQMLYNVASSMDMLSTPEDIIKSVTSLFKTSIKAQLLTGVSTLSHKISSTSAKPSLQQCFIECVHEALSTTNDDTINPEGNLQTAIALLKTIDATSSPTLRIK